MSLFQPNVVAQYIATLDYDKVATAYSVYKAYFLNPEKQENIRHSKEEQFQEGFLRELFVDVLGYTLNPTPNFNLRTEEKNVTDSKKADGAILINNEVVGVIELKGCNTTDLKKVETQAFGYKNQHRGATYVIISNFEKLRFYIDNSVDFEEFNLFNLSEEEFSLLYLCLAHENIEKNLPKTIKTKSVSKEEEITNKLYKDYSEFKQALFNDILVLNHVDTAEQKIVLFKKTQKLLDRLLFIFFAEDSGLLTPNTMRIHILDVWQKMREMGEEQPLYNRIKRYFTWLNEGFKNQVIEVFAYNGGLFKPDEVLDSLIISDELLYNYTLKLSEYNYASEVDVNILGHIFEHSLTEIEEVTNSLLGNEQPTVSKRKKDGVFYTPQYITKYIVENTVGKLCAEKKAEMKIDEEEYFSDKKRQKNTKKALFDKLNDYREWLLDITICDPACGSGAFLNAALQFLINEHKLIDEMQAKITGDAIVFPNIENVILENNLYGVDINEESVEIAKLALWLRTAQPYRKLSSLNNNIKCGNSLISDVEVAGDKAFDWEAEFPQVFEKGGFDVVIGNPPYGAELDDESKSYIMSKYKTCEYQVNTYVVFYEKGLLIVKDGGILGYITPATFTYQHYFRKLRTFMQQYTQVCICKYCYKVFDDADIGDAVSWIMRKQENKYSNVGLLICKSPNDISNQSLYKDYEQIVGQDGCYSITTSGLDFMKICINTVTLSDISNVIVGVKAYQQGKGEPKQTKQVVEEKRFTATSKIDSTYIKCVNGRDFHRYIFLSEPSMYLSYGKWLAEPRESAPFFEDEKIILRQTSDSLIATIDTNKYINLNNLYNVGSINRKFNVRYILALLNSKLLNYIYQSIAQEKGRLFAEVKKVYLGKLPIKDCELTKQKEFVVKTNLIIDGNIQLSLKRSKFLRILQTNFEGIKITGALQVFDEKEFSDFISELKKQKITLTPRQQDEWDEYFNDYKKLCNELSAQISSTDREIDKMVYDLYGLTDEEIDIVEGRKRN